MEHFIIGCITVLSFGVLGFLIGHNWGRVTGYIDGLLSRDS